MISLLGGTTFKVHWQLYNETKGYDLTGNLSTHHTKITKTKQNKIGSWYEGSTQNYLITPYITYFVQHYMLLPGRGCSMTLYCLGSEMTTFNGWLFNQSSISFISFSKDKSLVVYILGCIFLFLVETGLSCLED